MIVVDQHLELKATLTAALLALAPIAILLCGSAVLFARERSLSSLLQLVGAGCLLLVVLAHLAEGAHVFAWMGWGERHSIGHYLDFWSAIVGLTLFPIGYLAYVLRLKNTDVARASAERGG